MVGDSQISLIYTECQYDHSVGARNELHESEASEASVFCFDNLPLKNLARGRSSLFYFVMPTSF